MNTHQEVVRKIAHQIWEAEGQPEGLAEEHWERAERMAAQADQPEKAGLKRSIDPSEATGPNEPAQPDQT